VAQIKTEDGTHLYYDDWGAGPPVVLIHGWPLDADMWSEQALFLAEHGHRVVMYDRRGFGRSSHPWDGYTYDTLAADLKAIVDQLDLRGATLVGFSMGGGEVARYLARYGTERIAKAALVSAVTPFLLKTDDNPTGVDQAKLQPILDGLKADRAHFLAGFGKTFFGAGLLNKPVSDETLQWSQSIAMMASYRATLACAGAFSSTDFRADMAAFTVPTLIIHGTDDKTVPIDSSARVAAKLVPHAQYIEYEGEPHGLHATAKDRLNQDLLTFLKG
jgi:non-heme chloroperoxidase